MKADLRVYWEDGSEPVDFTVGIADFVAWEKAHDRSSASFHVSVPLKDRLWFAYRHLEPSAPFDDWILTVDNVVIVGSGDPVPLDSNPPTSTSEASLTGGADDDSAGS